MQLRIGATTIFFVLFFVLFNVHHSLGQEMAQLQIKENPNTDQLCYDVTLRYEGNGQIMIASQNYRFFYSSETAEFDASTSGLLLPNDTYTYRLVQHQNHVDGSKIGKFAFDHDLGFINASVILNNTNSLGAGIDALAPTIDLLRLCFDTNEDKKVHIIPARRAVTKDYGRAYIDVSYVNEKGKINSLKFTSFQDIHPR